MMMRALALLLLTPAVALPLAAQRRPASPVNTVPAAHVPPLPDPSGWGTHVLAMSRAPDGALWVGTYGQGIYVLRPGARVWENVRADTTGRSISWDFVHAFAFGSRPGEVWYGTIGNGWGLSTDNGRTWRNWQFRELGPRWQYVAPNGIVVQGDTVAVATADGIRVTGDRGATWRAIDDSGQGGLPSRYVLSVEPVARGSGLWVSTLRGLGVWNGTRFVPTQPNPMPVTSRVRSIFVVRARDAVVPAVLGGERCAGSLRPKRRQEEARWECMNLFTRGAATGAAVRAMAGCDNVLCAMATSLGAVYGARLGLAMQPAGGTARSRDVYAVVAPRGRETGDTLFGTACGLLGSQSEACLARGDSADVPAPAAPLHTWFARPIDSTGNHHIDQTYRYGSTMGGNFQQHQGVEFNNPVGTPVRAIGAGTVVHAGPAEQGALTVAIRHDTMLTTPQGRFYVFSTYYHNSRLLVTAGQRVTRGQPIAHAGATGRATNDHLHLEVHATPADSVQLVIDPAVRYPPYTTNPELWIQPLPGTGIVAGQVFNAAGQPVPQARVYGIVKPEPQETPFSFAETYGARAHPDPAYGEHFAVGDVPAGEYTLGVEVDGRRIFRRVRVEAGKVSWVEFRP